MLKWYLRIYIFVKYLKCVWKSNCICIIRNDSKKKKSEDRVPESGFDFWVVSVWRRGRHTTVVASMVSGTRGHLGFIKNSGERG